MTLRRQFCEAVARAISAQQSSLCCGLDPDLSKIPGAIGLAENPDERAIAFLVGVIDATRPFVSAYKIQKAYFDLLDDPMGSLKTVVREIRSKTDVPIILDSKIGDTDNTMLAHMQYCNERLAIDAVVLNPYMGAEVLTPFHGEGKCGGVVMVRTSNRGAGLLQDRRLVDGRAVWEYMLNIVLEEWKSGADIIPVLTSTTSLGESVTVKSLPPELPIFIAGFGAQGGSLEGVKDLWLNGGRSVLVNSSRDILFPSGATPAKAWKQTIAEAAKKARDRIAIAISSK